MKRKLVAMILGLACILSLAVPASAADLPQPEGEPVFAETHFQVNFNDVNVNIIGESDVQITFADSVSPISTRHVATSQEDIRLLEQALTENPDLIEVVANPHSSDGELVAISGTEAPLLFVEDHYERVPEAVFRSTYESSDDSLKGKFALFTTVSRSYNTNSNGRYTYTTTTYGRWTENSFLGGSDYPSYGEDFVLQSTPDTWVRLTDTMTARYDDATDGKQGDEFWRNDGGDHYIHWGIEDDPLGIRQNRRFTLTCESEGPARSTTRMINSYYVHTWKSLSLSVSVSASSERQVSLTLTPSIKDNNWQLYNYVSFDF